MALSSSWLNYLGRHEGRSAGGFLQSVGVYMEGFGDAEVGNLADDVGNVANFIGHQHVLADKDTMINRK